MKTAMTLLTFLIAISIGSLSYAENTSPSASDKSSLDEQATIAPKAVTVPVTTRVIPSNETEIDYAYDSDDDGC